MTGTKGSVYLLVLFFLVVAGLAHYLLLEQLVLFVSILGVFYLGVHVMAVAVYKAWQTRHKPRLFRKKEFTVAFASSLALFAIVQQGDVVVSMVCFGAAILLIQVLRWGEEEATSRVSERPVERGAG